MQFYALESDKLLFAGVARRGKNYRCPECRRLVRLRAGLRRKLHFYHLKSSSTCRQHQRGPVHLALQSLLLESFPQGELAMEAPFPEINRVADLKWERERLVFEIQCSSISAEEVHARCRDYESVGYRAVWLLHDQKFNQKRLTLPEELLRCQEVAYYATIGNKGQPLVYDQTERLSSRRRVMRGPPLPIDLKAPKRKGALLYFCGDLTDRGVKKIVQKERARFSITSLGREVWHALLEKRCQ